VKALPDILKFHDTSGAPHYDAAGYPKLIRPRHYFWTSVAWKFLVLG